jgi:hypothetical protein
MKPFRCQHMEQYISKRNYESTVEQETPISRLEQQKWPLNFVTSFPKVYIWDLGLRIPNAQPPFFSYIAVCIHRHLFEEWLWSNFFLEKSG